ncbi:SulP family inorganic anion transporter [Fictibacillus enclensis]|uniref:SulP family inorganic anion transporter n=1 Tax=Fictibacillus enclensis TaxID=1017270 RepID=UPI0025A0FA68|nr:SulP family inorganic anion transporter [Fictibacillus enclensis]MDM5198040.1 SulP family inorganic anion transporter [Fictibacillus enclensis]
MGLVNRFKGYTLSDLRKDLVAGFIVGIVAIPLGMAFAIASGVRPENGLYTVIIAGILISLLGGSRYQIGGPTGAFVPILLGIVMQYGFQNLLIAGFMAGIMLVIMGLLKWGSLIKYIPRPVIIGFTAGIAVIIFSGQISNFLGLKDVEKHEEFHLNMMAIWDKISTFNGKSVLVALVCLALLIAVPKITSKIPPALIGLLGSTLIGFLFFQDQIPTIGTAFGDIPNKLPEFQFFDLSLEKIIYLLPPAIAIALLGGIESLLSAMVADGMKQGYKHDSNKELVGQGIANMVAPLFGGIPATGAIARTATNIRNGAISKVSGVFHGVVVLLVLLLFAPYASLIPLASMAPILMVVAWNMSEKKQFMHVLKTKTMDSVILLTTFLLTVFTDLATAVIAGLLLAFVIFITRMSRALHIKKGKTALTHLSEDEKEGIEVITLNGPLFFGSTDVLEESVSAKQKEKVVILKLQDVPYIDISAEAALLNIVTKVNRQDGELLIVGLQPEPKQLLERTGLTHEIGHHRFFERMEDALGTAKQLMKTKVSSQIS